MGTLQTWVNGWSGKILGLQSWSDDLADSVRESAAELNSDLWGDGGVLDAKAAVTHAAAKLTVGTAQVGWTDTGYRVTIGGPAADGYDGVPFEDTAATQYDIAVRSNDVPGKAEQGFDGSFDYQYWIEQTGEILTPSSVVDGGGSITITMTGALNAQSKWTDAADTRPVIVWLVSPKAATAEAIYTGELDTDGVGGFTITIPHELGQGTVSTTAADYRVLLQGLSIAGVGVLNGTANYVFLGEITGTTGVFDDTDQNLINSIGTWISAFNIQHDSTTGVHLDVTADSAVISGTAAPVLQVKRTSLEDTAAIEVLETGGLVKIALVPGAAGTAGGGGSILFPNPTDSSDDVVLIDVQGGATAVEVNLTNSTGIGAAGLRIIDGDLDLDTGAFSCIGVADLFSGHIQNGGYGLDVSGDSTAVDYTATDSVYSHDGLSATPGFCYTDSIEFEVDCSPYCGGWESKSPSVTNWAFTDGTPSYVAPDNAVLNVWRFPLSDLWPPSQDYTTIVRVVNSIEIRYRRVAAGDAFTVTLKRQIRDGTAGVLTVATATPGTSASFTTHSEAVAHDVNRNYRYWLEISCDAATSGDDIRIANLALNMDKNGVE